MANRFTGSATVVVDRSPEDVFEYLRDVHRHNEWSPKPYRVEGIEGPVELGSTFKSYGWIPGDAEHQNDVEVVELDAPNRLKFKSIESGEEFINTYVVTPEGSSSRVEKMYDMPKPKGALGIVFPVVFATVVKPAIAKGMDMFKQKLDAGA